MGNGVGAGVGLSVVGLSVVGTGIVGAGVTAQVSHARGERRCSDSGWVGVPDGFPQAQQLAAGLLYTVAQVT